MSAPAGFSDTERLTWLIVNHGSFGMTGHYLGDGRWDERVFVRYECKLGYEWHCYDGVTPREAIDNAINAPPCRDSHTRYGCVNARSWHDDVHEAPTATLRARIAALEARA